MKYVGYTLLGLAIFAGLLGVGWMVQGNDFFLTKVFAPKYEAVRRETFEQSRAFTQGQISNMRKMEQDYIGAPPANRAGFASVIVSEADRMGDGQYPADLKAFLDCIRGHQGQDYNCSPGAVN